MKPRLALTPAYRVALIDCRSKGMNVLDCSACLGFDPKVIRRWLHELDLPLRLNRGRMSGTCVQSETPHA